MRRVLIVLVVMLSACGGSPSAPTGQIPDVVGTYTGTTEMTFPEVGASLTNCRTSTSVTQSGATVNIAPLVLKGCGGVSSISLGQATIDSTGAIQGRGRGTFDDQNCGRYNYTSSGGFSGRDLRLYLTATSTGTACLTVTITITLSR